MGSRYAFFVEKVLACGVLILVGCSALVGCSGKGRGALVDGGTPLADGGSDPAVGTNCSRLCVRLSSCGAEVGPTAGCSAACVAEVGAYGALGATVLATCVSCLETRSCAEVAAGSCEASCPNVPGLPEGDAGTGRTCDSVWNVERVEYEVRCEWDPSDEDYSCDCYNDGVDVSFFYSLDYCDVDDAARRDRACRGCGDSRFDPACDE